jgi:hypothetical protein
MGWNFGFKEQCSMLLKYQPNTCHLLIRLLEKSIRGSGVCWIGRRTESGLAAS